jgi:hypothetical protein
MATQQRYALLIGVDEYEDRYAIQPLRYCGKDCEILRRALIHSAGFPPDNVLLLSGTADRPENLPRRNNIIGHLRRWSERPRNDDLFVLAFCGHGLEVDGSVFLMPSDARATDLSMTALPVKFLREALEACPAASKLLLLDACHSGRGRDMTPMTPSFAANLRVEGVTILTACKVSEVAHEDEQVGHGIFSYHLAKGLEGAAADSSGAVTVDGLYRHIHREVTSWAQARGASQTPWRLCEGVGDPILVGRRPPKARQIEPGASLSVPRFHYGSVVPVEYYIDRERELAEAQELVDTGHSFLLVGDRRAGKTSFCHKLIHQLMGRPDNTVLAGYLNLQQWEDLSVKTFLRGTIDTMLSEIARQVFRIKYSDLLRRNPADASPGLASDAAFGSFLNVFRQVRRQVQHAEGKAGPSLAPQDFVRFVRDLLEIMRLKGWGSYVTLYDESNLLPGSFSVEVLISNEEALNQAGVVSVYAASSEMADSFAALHASFTDEVRIGPFARIEDASTLLSRYYFDGTTQPGELPLTRPALELLWELTGGKPFLIQLVAGHSFREAHASQSARVDDGHVRMACERLKKERPDVRFVSRGG